MTPKRTARPVRARVARAPEMAGSCPVCRIDLAGQSKMRHFKAEHPRYWRSVLLRVGSPWVFLAVMFGLAASHAASWTFIVVLVGFLGLSLFARARSSTERAQRGLGLSGGQWVRGAGLGLMLMSLAFAVVAGVISLMR